jgi:hypothetical protein
MVASLCGMNGVSIGLSFGGLTSGVAGCERPGGGELNAGAGVGGLGPGAVELRWKCCSHPCTVVGNLKAARANDHLFRPPPARS